MFSRIKNLHSLLYPMNKCYVRKQHQNKFFFSINSPKYNKTLLISLFSPHLNIINLINIFVFNSPRYMRQGAVKLPILPNAEQDPTARFLNSVGAISPVMLKFMQNALIIAVLPAITSDVIVCGPKMPWSVVVLN